MGKKLAIRGHSTRGKEVIEILEMMGGRSNCGVSGSIPHHYYYLNTPTYIDAFAFESDFFIRNKNNFAFYTLEEFLEKYPYKVGDLVDRNIDYVSCIIDDMRWNSEKCCVEYHLNYLNGSEYGWHVSDCLIKPENKDVIIGTKIKSTGFMQMGKTVSVIFNSANYENEVELQLGDYEIKVRDGKTFAVLKKLTYPKTYKECCEVLNYCGDYFLTTYDNNGNPSIISNILNSINILTKLLICRDAYWKIYGEQMGLDGPWKANFTQDSGIKYNILFANGEVIWNRPECEGIICSRVLAFPTPEIRDTFYENFKDLIEQCKELL